METNLRDAIQEYEQSYDQLSKEESLGLSKHEYVAVAMAAKALDTQKEILQRLKKLEEKSAGQRLQQTVGEGGIEDLHTRNAAQTRYRQ